MRQTGSEEIGKQPSGGSGGIRDRAALEPALARPRSEHDRDLNMETDASQ
jgi:hypothetical protein